MDTADYWYYISPTVRRMRPVRERFVREQDLANWRGFRTVYGYRSSTVEQILNSSNFRQLQTAIVCSTTLLVDFDNNENAANEFKRQLLKANLSFEKYDSGNRSVHFHVGIIPMVGVDVPRKQRVWVTRYAPGADVSIYNPTGLYRLPNTWHEKNPGNRKQLVDRNDTAYVLDLSSVALPPRVQVGHKPEQQSQYALVKLNKACSDLVGTGGRRCHVWRIGTLAYDAGLDYKTAVSYAQKWNYSYAQPPLDSDTVEGKIYEAYQQRTLSSI